MVVKEELRKHTLCNFDSKTTGFYITSGSTLFILIKMNPLQHLLKPRIRPERIHNRMR